MSFVPQVTPVEVGHAIHNHAVQTAATYGILNNYLQATNDRISRAEGELKTIVNNTGVGLSAIKSGLQKLQEKEEENRNGVVACQAQEEKLGDSVGQLESKVDELGERVRTGDQKLEGIWQELHSLRQELQEFEARLGEKINSFFSPVTFTAPIVCASGGPVGEGDTPETRENWGSAGETGYVELTLEAPGEGVVSTEGQPREPSPGSSSINTPNSKLHTLNDRREEQVSP